MNSQQMEMMMQVLAGGGFMPLPDRFPGEPDWRARRAPLTALQKQMWEAAVESGAGDGEAAEAIRRLLAAHPEAAGQVDFNSDEGGFHLLHNAALNNQAQLARVLLDTGAAVDARAPSTLETPLLVASCWGGADVIRLLLERGANPHLLDRWGQTALQKLEDKARSHTRPDLVARYAEARRLIKAAVEASAPLSKKAKKEGGCGACGRTDGKLSICGRCRLRSYCSHACQSRDWPAHKQRCKAAAELRADLAVLADPGADKEARRGIMQRLVLNPSLRPLAVDLKGIKQLLEAAPSDPPVTLAVLDGRSQYDTVFPTLYALSSLLVEREGTVPLPPHPRLPYHSTDAARQFASAAGFEVVLERILAADCPQQERQHYIRVLSSLCMAHQEQIVPRHVVAKGRGPAVVKLLGRLVREHGDDNAVLANTCSCLAALTMMEEGPSFGELTRQALATASCASAGSSQQAQAQAGAEELGAVAAAIFEHVDLETVARRVYSPGGGVAQSPPELLLVLCRRRAGFERLMADAYIKRQMLHAFYANLYLASPTAAAHGLEFWTVAHLWRPGTLVRHWDAAQVGLREVALSGLEDMGFVQALLDNLDTARAPPRVLCSAFISERHAAKAALLMAQVVLTPLCPAAVVEDLAHVCDVVVDMAQACSDADAVRLLAPIVALCKSIEEETARLQRREERRQGGGRR